MDAAAPVCMQERVGNSIRGYIEDIFCIICCTGVLWKCAAERVRGDAEIRSFFILSKLLATYARIAVVGWVKC